MEPMQLNRRSFLAGSLAAPALLQGAASRNYMVYVGTYTNTKSKGIYGYRFDTKSGKLDPQGLMGECPNPSFLTFHPNRKFVYAVGEGGPRGGTVSAFSRDAASGKLTLLNQIPSRGSSPCNTL